MSKWKNWRNWSKHDRRLINSIVGDLKEDPTVLKMRDFVQHGKTSTYDHCISVMEASYKLDRILNTRCDKRVLLRGAMLHDLYLYDWHDHPLNWNIFKMHGFTHPEAARKNAERIFNVDEDIQNVIKSHMWPLTLRSYPKSKEAAIVCLADKLVATRETLRR